VTLKVALDSALLRRRDEQTVTAGGIGGVSVRMFPREEIDDAFLVVSRDPVAAACVSEIIKMVGKIRMKMVAGIVGEDEPLPREFFEVFEQQLNKLIPEIVSVSNALGFVPVILTMHKEGEDPIDADPLFTEVVHGGIGGKAWADKSGTRYPLQIPGIVIPSHRVLDFGVATTVATGDERFICRPRNGRAGMPSNWVYTSIGGVDDILANVRFCQFFEFPRAGLRSPAISSMRYIQAIQAAEREWLVATGNMAMPLVHTEYVAPTSDDKILGSFGASMLANQRKQTIIRDLRSGQQELMNPYVQRSVGQRMMEQMNREAAVSSSKIVDGLCGGIGAFQTVQTPEQYASRVALIDPDLRVVSGPVASAPSNVHEMIMMWKNGQAGCFGIHLSMFMSGVSRMNDTDIAMETALNTRNFFRSRISGFVTQVWDATCGPILADMAVELGDVVMRRIQTALRENMREAEAEMHVTTSDAPLVEKEGTSIKRGRALHFMGGSDGETDAGVALRRRQKPLSGTHSGPDDADKDVGEKSIEVALAKSVKHHADAVVRLMREKLNLQRCTVKTSFEGERDYERQKQAYEDGLLAWEEYAPMLAAAIGVDESRLSKEDPKRAEVARALDEECRAMRMRASVALETELARRNAGLDREMGGPGAGKSGGRPSGTSRKRGRVLSSGGEE
jgi:hypothetical protein